MNTERKIKHYRISWRRHLGKGTQERYMVIWGDSECNGLQVELSGISIKQHVGGAARTGCTDLQSVRGLSGSSVEFILE